MGLRLQFGGLLVRIQSGLKRFRVASGRQLFVSIAHSEGSALIWTSRSKFSPKLSWTASS